MAVEYNPTQWVKSLPTPADDERHMPGPKSLPLYNESYYFPIYDPKQEIGVVFRFGMLANQKQANVYLFITHKNVVVHSYYEKLAPLPPMEPRHMEAGGLSVDIDKPLERFRLRYKSGSSGFDLTWQGFSPAYMFPRPAGATFEESMAHIEQGAFVTGTVTIGGVPYKFDGLGHRDKSWGHERDWAKYYGWTYLSGEFEPDFWFNTSRFELTPGYPIFVGCLWDGKELSWASDIVIDVKTTDAGTRQLGVEARFKDERGRQYHVIGEKPMVTGIFQFDKTMLRDGISVFRMGNRIGYGIIEHGYVEDLKR
jgi:hypothetical protein